MKILNLKSINWASDNVYVIIKADTDEGDDLSISTPFNEESILWDQIKDIPIDQIEAYVPPEIQTQVQTDTITKEMLKHELEELQKRLNMLDA